MSDCQWYIIGYLMSQYRKETTLGINNITKSDIDKFCSCISIQIVRWKYFLLETFSKTHYIGGINCLISTNSD